MSVLPRPSEDMLSWLQKTFRNFIWGSSKPRMALLQLEQEISEGGLKLTNVSCLNDGLKLAWIKRACLKSGDWQNLLESLSDLGT